VEELAFAPSVEVGRSHLPSPISHPGLETLEHLTSLLGGRYLLERELGVGGMATVYLALDVKHDRHVAIKVLRPDVVRGRTVVLIDDVLTSGSTAEACARILRRAGAGWVELLSWARVVRPSQLMR